MPPKLTKLTVRRGYAGFEPDDGVPGGGRNESILSKSSRDHAMIAAL